MLYKSTRDANVKVSSATAIAQGISNEGGLFVPECIPTLTDADFKRIAELDYIGRAKEVLKLYLTDFTEEELAAFSAMLSRLQSALRAADTEEVDA